MESPPECWKGINTQQSRRGGWIGRSRNNRMGIAAGGVGGSLGRV